MAAPPDTVKAVFFAALDKEPAERSTFLDSACQGDDNLRRRVEALLQAGEAADPLLDRPAAWHLEQPPTTQPEEGLLLPEAGPRDVSEPTQAGRFRLLGEIARGGMGVVLRAHDPEMDRFLAVKVVLPQYKDDPSLTSRFLGEARLAGQLQHPGVVPVHDLGRLADGRPFFAMKLIEGRTLAQLLRDRPHQGHDRPRFVRYFEAVCQAIGYAHSRGVIHRDLKPSNVMVGAFGEVQVMDWGLAKVLSEEEGGRMKEEGERASGSSFLLPPSSLPATRPGSVLGTPAYVAPEQASGKTEHLDERTDVFGLGAILCEVLTGQPPYVGKDHFQVCRLAARAELADAQARLGACGADAELVGLALACLSPKPEDRPRDGRAVATALTAHLDGVQARLRKAELAEAEARARAAGEAKRRRLALALACTVLGAVALGAAAALWLQADRQARQTELQARQTERTREITDALNQATLLREKAGAATADSAALFAQAREQAQRARTLVQTGPADEALTARVRRLQEELDEEEKDRRLVAAIDAARLAQGETDAGKGRFAMDKAVPRFREAFRAYGLAAGEGEPAAAAARLRQRPPPVREAATAALEEWIDLATDPAFHVREPHLDWLRAVAAAVADEGLTRQIRAACEEKDPGQRRAALEKLAAAADVRQLPAVTLTRLASRLLAAQSTPSALQLLRRAQQQYPEDFWVNHSLGYYLVLAEPLRWVEAVRYLTAAVALRPNSPGVHLNLGFALQTGGQLDEALACCRKAIALDPHYVAAHVNLGLALHGKLQVDEAIACYHRAIALDPKYAGAHNNLGNALQGKMQVDEAIACYKKAIELDPKYATAHNNLGSALHGKMQVDEAIACYKKAIELDPKDVRAHYNLGCALNAGGKGDEAIASFRQAIALEPKFAAAHYNLGNALQVRGQLDEAIPCWRRAVALDPKYATRQYHLGSALLSRGEFDEAVVCFRKAIEIDPAKAEAHCNLGLALQKRGDFAEALGPLRRGHELGSKRRGWEYDSGTWVRDCERLIEREKQLLDVLAGKSKPADARERLAWADLCARTRRYAAAARLWGEAFGTDGQLADDLKANYRYHAARAAARAAAGKGRDAGGQEDFQKADLRKRALGWLKADLDARANQPASVRAAMLRQWQADEALAGVRGEPVLRALPEAERAAWGDFWSEVQKHLRDAGGR